MSGWTPTPEAWARLGARIRAERERQGLSRKELAELAGVSASSIQSAERGAVPKTRWPQSLSAIERAIGWAPGAMITVLEGGDAKPTSSLTTTAESLRTDIKVVESFDELPREVKRGLPEVLRFGQICVANGAPEWLGETYDNAVAALLRALYEPPADAARAYLMGSQGAVPGPGMTDALGRLSARVAELEGILERQGEQTPQQELGDALHAARRDADMSLEQVVLETAITAAVLQRMEAGDFDFYRAKQEGVGYLRKLAALYGVPPQPLVDMFRRVQNQPRHTPSDYGKQGVPYEGSAEERKRRHEAVAKKLL